MNSKKFLLSSLIAIALGASNNMVSWGAETGIEYVQGGEKTRASGLAKILNLEKHGSYRKRRARQFSSWKIVYRGL